MDVVLFDKGEFCPTTLFSALRCEGLDGSWNAHLHLAHYFFFLFRWPSAWNRPGHTLPISSQALRRLPLVMMRDDGRSTMADDDDG